MLPIFSYKYVSINAVLKEDMWTFQRSVLNLNVRLATYLKYRFAPSKISKFK